MKSKRGVGGGSVQLLGVLLGVVMVAVGIVGFLGFVPGLAVACTSSSGCSSEVVSAVFTTTQVELAVTLTDHSTVLLNGDLKDPSLVGKIMIAWGDYKTQYIGVGAVVNHTYATAGKYYIDEFVWGNFASDPPNFVNFTSYGYFVNVSLLTPRLPPAYSLVPAISYTQVNASISVRDATTEVNITALSLTINWGDGTAAATIAKDGTLSHTYVAPSNATGTTVMTYALSETATGTDPEGVAVTEMAKDSVTVTFVSTPPCDTTACQCAGPNPPASCTPTPPPVVSPSTTPTYYFNALTGLLIVAGVALIIVFLIPIFDPRLWVGIVAAGVVGGFVAGFIVGGPGPL